MSYKIINNWLSDIDFVSIVTRLNAKGIRLYREKVSVNLLRKEFKTAFEEVLILDNEYDNPLIECYMIDSQTLIISIESINFEQTFNITENE